MPEQQEPFRKPSDRRGRPTDAPSRKPAQTAHTLHLLPHLAFSVWLLAGVVLVNVFIIFLTGLSLIESRNQYHEQAQITTRNLSQILAENTEGLIAQVDVALFGLAEETQRQTASGGIDHAALNAYILRLHSRLPYVDSIRLGDAQGMITDGVGVDAEQRVNIADRDYFIAVRGDADAGLAISKPVLGRISGKWVIIFARRINAPDRRFAGAVYATMTLENFTKILATVDVGKRGVVTMRGAEMGVIARYPESKSASTAVGSREVSPELQELMGHGATFATYDTAERTGKVARTITLRQVGARTLYVLVGLAKADYLEPWRKHTVRIALLEFVFLMITLLLSGLFHFYWKRQVASALALAEQEAKFRIVADFTYEWEYWESAGKKLLFMSPSCAQVTGYTREEFLADPGLLDRIVYPEDLEKIEAHRVDIADKDTAEVEFRILRRDGEIRWIAHGCRAVYAQDGKALGRRVSNRDISEMVRLTEELRDLARTDVLTGLANRRAFVEAAEAEFERGKRYGSNGAVLMIDIDHFKMINDRNGHEAGDKVLMSLAKLLKASARTPDLPARLGGEEFVYLLISTPLAGALVTAERIRKAVDEMVVSYAAGELRLTVSIGAASFAAGDEGWEDALRRADLAMYQAKQGGRNRVIVADEKEAEE
jgi:diguanylate cyclase (GGDEF)-like protein/PAS domain S-box-containing protein